MTNSRITLSAISALCLMMASPQTAFAQDILNELAAMQEAAFKVPFEDAGFAARDAFLAVRDKARAALATETDPQRQVALKRLWGVNSFNAAQSYDPTNEEESLLEIALLDDTRRLLGEILAKDPTDEQSYEFRGATGQLFDYGQARNDPRWIEWSADRVQANRYREAQEPAEWLEKNALAQALLDHGWLIKDVTLIAEGKAIASTIPEDEMRSQTQTKLESIAAGDAPY